MRYRIEYADGKCCNFANSRKDLLDWLKLLKDEESQKSIREVIRQFEKYRDYVNKNAG